MQTRCVCMRLSLSLSLALSLARALSLSLSLSLSLLHSFSLCDVHPLAFVNSEVHVQVCQRALLLAAHAGLLFVAVRALYLGAKAHQPGRSSWVFPALPVLSGSTTSCGVVESFYFGIPGSSSSSITTPDTGEELKQGEGMTAMEAAIWSHAPIAADPTTLPVEHHEILSVLLTWGRNGQGAPVKREHVLLKDALRHTAAVLPPRYTHANAHAHTHT